MKKYLVPLVLFFGSIISICNIYQFIQVNEKFLFYIYLTIAVSFLTGLVFSILKFRVKYIIVIILCFFPCVIAFLFFSYQPKVPNTYLIYASEKVASFLGADYCELSESKKVESVLALQRDLNLKLIGYEQLVSGIKVFSFGDNNISDHGRGLPLDLLISIDRSYFSRLNLVIAKQFGGGDDIYEIKQCH